MKNKIANMSQTDFNQLRLHKQIHWAKKLNIPPDDVDENVVAEQEAALGIRLLESMNSLYGKNSDMVKGWEKVLKCLG